LNIPEKMKAAVLMAPDILEIKEVATPQPGPADVLIKVDSCAICGSDVSLMSNPWPGQPPYGAFIPGHEYSGVVVALGETVDEFKLGDRVAVEAHYGCGRCLNCRRGDYTSCLNPTTIHMISSRQWPVYVSGVRDKLDGSSSVSMKQVQ
jgi:L-iditol 2-dehydrogenase